MRSVTYDGQFTRTDLRHAYILHYKSGILAALLIADAVLCVAMLALFLTGQWTWSLQMLPNIAIPVIFLSAPLWLPYLLARSQWRVNAALRGRNSGAIRAEGIHAENGLAVGDIRWSAFVDYKLSPGMLLLYQTPNAFHLFTRQMFATDEDWDTFVSLVQKRIAKRQPAGRNWGIVFIVLLALILIGTLIFGLLPSSN